MAEGRGNAPRAFHNPPRVRTVFVTLTVPSKWRRGQESNLRDRETSLGLASQHITTLSPLHVDILLLESDDDELLES